VVRIHLIPPREHVTQKNGIKHSPSIAIINGQDVIPVNVSWAILLNEFILQLNSSVKYGTEIVPVDLEKIVDAAASRVNRVFPLICKSRLKKDLLRIVNTLCAIAQGDEVTENIGTYSLGDYAPFMRAPHRMDLMISAMAKNGCWNCNQKCLHCYAAGQELSNTPELSTGEWMYIIDKLREIGIPQLTFTGGEPTLRKDLVELVEYSQWFVTRLNTNGILLTKELCKKLYDASLDSVQVTLYSYDATVHNQLVGAPMHHKTVEGIKNALEAGLNLSINTPLCTINKDYVETLKYAHNLGVVYVTCSGLIVTGNAEKEASRRTQLSSEELYEIIKEAKAFCDANGMQMSFTSPGWIEEEKLRALKLNVPTCGACLSNMAITPDGGIVPCQSWLSGESLGNILEDDWEEVWDGDACSKIRAHSAKMDFTCPLRRNTENEE
jgi:MoaA/NifB/PqqE/SkfB family radical SAM enzyme